MRRYLTQHAAAFSDAMRKLSAAPLGALLSLMVIGSALALPTAGLLIFDNLDNLVGQLSKAQQISLFLNESANRKAIDEIELRLRVSDIGKWRFVSRDEALDHLKSIEGVSEILDSLPKNPLPDAFIVEPADIDPKSIEKLAELFSRWPEVDHVQLDSEWMRRLDVFLRIGRLVVLMLAGLFGSALVIVTFNTIRLQILAQADEIAVARLIGATNAFIRRPFQYFGLLQGFLGGLFAVLLVFAGTRLLASPLEELMALYRFQGEFRHLNLERIAALSAFGAFLGWFGACLSVNVHLNRTF